MNAHTHEHQDYGFVIGLFAGTFVGAGLMMWLAPRTASGSSANDRFGEESRQAGFRTVSAGQHPCRRDSRRSHPERSGRP